MRVDQNGVRSSCDGLARPTQSGVLQRSLLDPQPRASGTPDWR